jgi:hypothetical protein
MSSIVAEPKADALPYLLRSGEYRSARTALSAGAPTLIRRVIRERSVRRRGFSKGKYGQRVIAADQSASDVDFSPV